MFEHEGLRVDLVGRLVSVHGEEVQLTPREYDLLKVLVQHAGRVLTHRQLLSRVWGPEYGDEVEYLRVFINQLRKKIERDPANPQHLLTEPWVGYRLVVDPDTR